MFPFLTSGLHQKEKIGSEKNATQCPGGRGGQHSWKNAQTAQTRLCYFSGLLCYFFASGHANTVFLHFALKTEM